MNQKNSILIMFKNDSWHELVSSYTPSEIVKSLPFKDALRLAFKLLYNKKWDENLQEIAIILLYEIRKIYPAMWKESWKYDALLGIACNITCKHDERYQAFKQAFERTKSPPPGLLIELARCCICPGTPPISYDEAITLVLQALKEAPYADAIGLLSHIYSLKEDKSQEEYWTTILKNTDQECVTPPIEPQFLIDEYLQGI